MLCPVKLNRRGRVFNEYVLVFPVEDNLLFCKIEIDLVISHKFLRCFVLRSV